MPGISVVALELSRNDMDKWMPYVEKSFEEQLKEMEKKIRKVCEQLKQTDKDQWIISWKEYGLTNGFVGDHKNRYLSLEQKAELKRVMKALTSEFPKLTIISGTVATKRVVNLKNQPEKSTDLEEAFTRTAEPSEELDAYVILAGEKELTGEDLNVVRNTAYVFSGGECTGRHDKTALFNETEHFYPDAPVVFRPGKGRSHSPLIDTRFGVEICREHALGVMSDSIQPQIQIPLMQFVLSDSVSFRPDQMVSPYAIHIDSFYPIRLITDIANPEVTLYSYDVLTEDAELKRVIPQNRKEFLTSCVLDMMSREEITGLGVGFLVNRSFNLEDYKNLMQLIYQKRADFQDPSNVNDILIHLAASYTGGAFTEIEEVDKLIESFSPGGNPPVSVQKPSQEVPPPPAPDENPEASVPKPSQEVPPPLAPAENPEASIPKPSQEVPPTPETAQKESLEEVVARDRGVTVTLPPSVDFKQKLKESQEEDLEKESNFRPTK